MQPDRQLRTRHRRFAGRYRAQPGPHPRPKVLVWSYVLPIHPNFGFIVYLGQRTREPPYQPGRREVEIDLAVETQLGHALNDFRTESLTSTGYNRRTAALN